MEEKYTDDQDTYTDNQDTYTDDQDTYTYTDTAEPAPRRRGNPLTKLVGIIIVLAVIAGLVLLFFFNLTVSGALDDLATAIKNEDLNALESIMYDEECYEESIDEFWYLEDWIYEDFSTFDSVSITIDSKTKDGSYAEVYATVIVDDSGYQEEYPLYVELNKKGVNWYVSYFYVDDEY